MNNEEKIAAFFWIQVVVIGLSQVLLVAFVLGFFLGHFTGTDHVTTVTAQAVEKEEAEEAKTDEAAPAEALAKAEAEEAKHAEMVNANNQGKEAEKAEAKEAEAKETEKAASGAGMEIFTTNCGTCHTLSEAGTTGEIGPNLDQLQPELALVETQVTNGGGGMPAFKEVLSEEEIVTVAEYVSSVAGTE
jgi:mono/diheme cytochrome c family protein